MPGSVHDKKWFQTFQVITKQSMNNSKIKLLWSPKLCKRITFNIFISWIRRYFFFKNDIIGNNNHRIQIFPNEIQWYFNHLHSILSRDAASECAYCWPHEDDRNITLSLYECFNVCDRKNNNFAKDIAAFSGLISW